MKNCSNLKANPHTFKHKKDIVVVRKKAERNLLTKDPRIYNCSWRNAHKATETPK